MFLSCFLGALAVNWIFMQKTPDEIIRDEIRALNPYLVPDSKGLVKLDAMENPYPLPEWLRVKVARLVEQTRPNR